MRHGVSIFTTSNGKTETSKINKYNIVKGNILVTIKKNQLRFEK